MDVSSSSLTLEIRPQLGPQELFLSSPADITIYGGAAGGGKTWALLVEPLRHYQNGDFGAVIFRRTYPEIALEGGLWDESERLYSYFGARSIKGDLYWIFPSGMKITFAHLQHETDLQGYQGAQIPLIGFDQLEHFTAKMFFYMLSRNRSMCGVRPYLRATCNPEPGWLADFLAYWIDDDGYARLELAGKLRWFVRVNEILEWADTEQELRECYPHLDPLSVTFIPASIYDNQVLLDQDPGYLAKLQALPLVDRMRLLGDPKRGGNWKITPSAGKVLNRAWFKIVDEIPKGGVVVRRWDFASTEKELNKDDPDYTASCLMLKAPDGNFYVLAITAEQMGPAEVERTFLNISRQDAARFQSEQRRYLVRWEEEPGSASRRESWRMVRALAGIDAKGIPSVKDKLIRAKPLRSQAEIGNVYLLRGLWNEGFLVHMHNQPDIEHDDIFDATGGALQDLTHEMPRQATSRQG